MVEKKGEGRLKQLLQSLKNGSMGIEEVPIPILQKNTVLVRNHYSLISTGTEKSKVDVARKNYIGKAIDKPEQVKMVLDTLKKEGFQNTYQKVINKLDAPSPLGYSCAGEVIGVGEQVKDYKIGDLVACSGAGYANHAEIVNIPANLITKVPDGITLQEAAFTTVGSIAMQGIRLAEAKIGENIAVIGLGLVGQLTVQILKAAGCTVIASDLDDYKVNVAIKNGINLATSGDNISKICKEISRGYGVDATIITAGTSSNSLIELAGEITRQKGKVVVVGAVRMDIPRSPYYEKELDIKISCSYGPGRYDPTYEEVGIDYPYGYVRWTENRNMQAFLKLIKDNKISVQDIVTHIFDFENANQAYELIMNPADEKYIGILLRYNTTNNIKQLIINNEKNQSLESEDIGLSIIGVGNFAKGILLPVVKKYKKLKLLGVMSATGVSAMGVMKKYGFQYASSESEVIFSDQETNAVLIATRHNHHVSLVTQALKNNKAVFVEKPLALNTSELKQVIEVYNNTNVPLLVGFNRRFSSSMIDIKQFFEDRISPMVIQYRVNAGFIPEDHWIQDEVQGGGRIIGEVCHFIDTMQYLTNSYPIKVYADTVIEPTRKKEVQDIVDIHIKFKDGSIGTIQYLSNGDRGCPKERMEVFCDNKIVVMNDFKREEYYYKGRKKVKNHKFDKGHKNEINTFIQCIMTDKEMPISFESLVYTTLTSFKIIESIQEGKKVAVSLDDY